MKKHCTSDTKNITQKHTMLTDTKVANNHLSVPLSQYHEPADPVLSVEIAPSQGPLPSEGCPGMHHTIIIKGEQPPWLQPKPVLQ